MIIQEDVDKLKELIQDALSEREDLGMALAYCDEGKWDLDDREEALADNRNANDALWQKFNEVFYSPEA